MQFNREKTPERIVHARGMTAKGYFEASSTPQAKGLSTVSLMLAETVAVL
jgi:catalase